MLQIPDSSSPERHDPRPSSASASASASPERLGNGLPRPALPLSAQERVAHIWRGARDRIAEIGRGADLNESRPRLADRPVALVCLAAVASAGLVAVAPLAVSWVTGSDIATVDEALPVLTRNDLVAPNAAADQTPASAQGAPGATATATESGATTPRPSDVIAAIADSTLAATPEPTSGPVIVHVAGAVAQPGVVELPANSRTVDAVQAGGGALADADLDRLNLAEPVWDGQRVWVPTIGAVDLPEVLEAPRPTPTPNSSGRIDTGTTALQRIEPVLIGINSARQSELETLPGIGPSMASGIIAYRDEHGSFLSVEELLDVSGIGPARLEALRPLITLS